jgi:predicted DNA-binding transcriptional regulator YafY
VHAAAAAVAEYVPPSSGVLDATGPDSCVLTSGSDSLDAMAFHLVRMGPRFTVLEPPELIEHIRALAGRLSEAVQACD